MKKILIPVLLISLILAIIYTMIRIDTPLQTKKSVDTLSIKREKQVSDSVQKVKNAQKDSIREEKSVRVEVLKKKFRFDVDEFDAAQSWYVHLDQIQKNSYNRNCLIPHINASGYIYMQDQYYAENSLSHTRIEVKIGEKIYKSSEVETFEKNNESQIGSGSIWETIHYTKPQDIEILKEIAENAVKPIKVRFVGKYNKDFDLADIDKKAIKDAWELHLLLK